MFMPLYDNIFYLSFIIRQKEPAPVGHRTWRCQWLLLVTRSFVHTQVSIKKLKGVSLNETMTLDINVCIFNSLSLQRIYISSKPKQKGISTVFLYLLWVTSPLQHSTLQHCFSNIVKYIAIKWFSLKVCKHLTRFIEWSAAACTPACTYRWAVLWWDWAKGSPPWSWHCTCHCCSSRSGTCHSGSVAGGWSPRSGPHGNSGGRPDETSNLTDSLHDQHH